MLTHVYSVTSQRKDVQFLNVRGHRTPSHIVWASPRSPGDMLHGPCAKSCETSLHLPTLCEPPSSNPLSLSHGPPLHWAAPLLGLLWQNAPGLGEQHFTLTTHSSPPTDIAGCGTALLGSYIWEAWGCPCHGKDSQRCVGRGLASPS